MKQYQYIFQPFKFANIETRNRIECSPMLACMATADGFVTREMIEFYAAFARGGAGIVTVGDAAVDMEYAVAHFGQLGLGSDSAIMGLSNLVEAIQKYGAKASIELDHAGRMSSPRVLQGRNPIGPSPLPTENEKQAALDKSRPVTPVTEMDQEMIDSVIDNFASAAQR